MKMTCWTGRRIMQKNMKFFWISIKCGMPWSLSWQDLVVQNLGVTPLEDVSEYIAYTEKTKIAEIVEALESFDMDRAMTDFSMEACKKADLYPDIWDYLEEEEEIKDDILTCFVKMKDFYKEILNHKGNVLVTIC